jgi:hypothetical protein
MSDKRVCAIHQPNFFPWLGYFDKIARCDKFVVLDDVQFPKSSKGTWSNRVMVNVQGRKHWITAPILRSSGVWRINETVFQVGNWRDKIIKTLRANYAKAPYFRQNSELVFELVSFGSNDLVEYNMHAIMKLCEFFGIKTEGKIVYASEFGFGSSSNELLIDLTLAAGCDTYMAGGGATGYQDLAVFRERGVGFCYQDFRHPRYEQANTEEFIPGLSVIDVLFNVGSFPGTERHGD